MNSGFQTKSKRSTSSRLLVAIFLLSMLVVCSQTVSENSAVAKQVESGQSAAAGFLGSDVSLLQPGQEGQAAMVYINSKVQWNQYNKIMLEPVEFWDSADSTISPSDPAHVDHICLQQT